MEALQLPFLAVLPALAIVAGLKDLTSMKIPNWISGLLILGFFPAALLVGFIPPSQFGGGNAGVYFLIVGGGALGLGLFVPYLFYKLRKPSWRQPEPEEVTQS